MIVARTPLRVSLFGGGTDLPAFTDVAKGAALSFSIDKYVRVMINPTRKNIRFIHEEIEQVHNITTMRNRIASKTLEWFGIDHGLDIVSMSDVPSVGSGLGGSSAFTVGLINALWFHKFGYECPQWDLAELACKIEIDECGYSIGIQDQYATAVGGFNLWEFPSRTYRANRVLSHSIHKPASIDLKRRLVLMHSGLYRDGTAAGILEQQSHTIESDPDKFAIMMGIRDRAYEASKEITWGRFQSIGRMMAENWEDKKRLSPGLTEPKFDEIYRHALTLGSPGGKLLGAGGGGFFLFLLPSYVTMNEKRDDVESVDFDHDEFVSEMIEKFPTMTAYPFNLENEGTKLIHV